MKDYFICIPSYNGDTEFLKPLLEVYRSAVESGLIKELVLIDDGSKDNTANIAEEAGITVIRHIDEKGQPLNIGKGAAFATGIRYGGMKYQGVVMSDDDMIDMKIEYLREIIKPLEEKGILMTKSPYSQEDQVCPHDYSGFRAINIDLLKQLYEKDHPDYKRWTDLFDFSRWGLEVILEKICPEEKQLIVDIKGLASKKRGGKTTDTNLHNHRSLTYTRMEREGMIQR